VEEGIAAQCNRINMSRTDIFNKRQLIKSVVIPSFNYVFMSFGFCEEAASKLDAKALPGLKKTGREVKNKWRLEAKKRIAAS
jgi:hypothetical protein